MLVRALSVAKDAAVLVDLRVHALSDGTQNRRSLATDEEMVSWHAWLVLARELFSRS